MSDPVIPEFCVSKISGIQEPQPIEPTALDPRLRGDDESERG